MSMTAAVEWWRITGTLALALASGSACDDTAPGPSSPREAHLRPNRLYSGAPPVIPHLVADLGRGDCLACHEHGDAAEGDRIAPVTPHPELERCEQCHVEQRTQGVFRDNTFPGSAYRRGLRSQPNGPLLIPHPLTLREDCLGCHGQAAAAWLRTSHPERTRCLQCHIPAAKDWPGARPRGGTNGG